MKAKIILQLHFPSNIFKLRSSIVPDKLISGLYVMWAIHFVPAYWTLLSKNSVTESVFVLDSVQSWIGPRSSLNTASCLIRHLIGPHFQMMIIIIIIPTTSLRQICSQGKLFSSFKHTLDIWLASCFPSVFSWITSEQNLLFLPFIYTKL